MPHFPPHLLAHLSIGTDIIHIPRIRRLLTSDSGRRVIPFVRRIFAPEEQGRVLERVEVTLREGPSRVDSLAQWMAGRYAAKEAAFKAMSSRTLSWHDIVIRDERKKPYITIRPPQRAPSAAEAKATEQKSSASTMEMTEDAVTAQLSISHDEEYATAVVLAIDDGGNGLE